MTTPAAIATITDPPQLEQQGGALAQTVEALTVTTPETFVEAGDLLKTIAVYVKQVEEVMGPIVSANHKAWQTVLQQRAKLLQPAENAKRLLGRRMADYEAEVRRQHEEAGRQRRLEQERLEAAERQRVTEEQRRLKAEAEERALAEATVAEAAGDRDLAERIVATPTVVTPPAPRAVFVPPATTTAPPPKVEGVAFRDNWSAEVVNLMALVKAVASGAQPITYLQANQTALNQVARALKDQLTIPGVRAKNDRTTSARV